MGGEQHIDDGSQPGVLGDETEEQNLGQPGHPEDRVSGDEVRQAFGDEDDDIDADDLEADDLDDEDGELDDEEDED